MATTHNPETNARALEQLIIQPPPSNEPPGFSGVRAGHPGLHERISGPDDVPVPAQPVIVSEETARLHGVLDRIAYFLQERERPDIYTVPFQAVVLGASWTVIVPPVGGAAMYVTGIWWHNSAAAVNGAFGQGTSSSDAEFFLGNNQAPTDMQFLNGQAVNSMTMTFPDWVFRCDPGKGFAVHLSGAANFEGYVQYFLRELSEQKYR